MAHKRILVVDDNREVTRMLKTTLSQLDPDLEVIGTLSGEEAILELARGPIDLLISDIRLPGMTGFQVMERFRKHNPRTRVFLISGVQDIKVREDVAHAGADAFFFKPLEMADFLDEVERNLGMVDSILPSQLDLTRDTMHVQQSRPSMTDRITMLRAELHASAALLVSDRGQVLVRAGELPSSDIENAILPELSAFLDHAGRISKAAGAACPVTFLTISGQSYDLHLTHVGDGYGLLLITPPLSSDELAHASQSILAAAGDVLAKLIELGVAPEIGAPQAKHEPSPSMPIKAHDTVPVRQAPVEKDAEPLTDPEMEELLLDTDKFKLNEADAFWERSAQKVTTADLSSTDSLSYEQAMQLGLAPPTPHR